MSTAPVRKTVQLPSRLSEKRLQAIRGNRPLPKTALGGEWLFRGAVVLLLSVITYSVGRATPLERCIEQRINQVVQSHNLKFRELSEAVRISETTKATNFCNGGNGRLNWNGNS